MALHSIRKCSKEAVFTKASRYASIVLLFCYAAITLYAIIAAQVTPVNALAAITLFVACSLVLISIALCRAWIFQCAVNLPFIVDHTCSIQKARRRFFRYFNFFEDNSRQHLVMVIFCPFILSIFYWANAFNHSTLDFQSKLIFATITFIAGLFGGFGLGYTICGASAFYRFGNEIMVRSSWDRFGIISIGFCLLKCWSIIFLTLICFLIGALLAAHSGGDTGILGSKVMLAGYPLIILLLFAFFACQWSLHLQLIHQKRRLCRQALVNLQNANLETNNSNFADDITRLKSLYQALETLPEWPLSFRTGATATVLTALGAIAMAIFDKGIETLLKGA